MKINKKKTKILFIAYFFPPIAGQGLPGAQRTVKFLRYLKKVESFVLTVRADCYPEYMKLNRNFVLPVKNETIYRSKTIDIFGFIIKIRNAIQNSIIRKKKSVKCQNRQAVSTVSVKKTNRVKDALSSILKYPDFASPWLFPAVIRGFKIIKKNDIDIIFATGMPWTSLLVGCFLSVVTGKKLVIDFRDPWVDNPYIDKGGFEQFLDKCCEFLVVKRAHLVIANTETLLKAMISRYSKYESKFIVLPNGYDEYDFQNLPGKIFSKDKYIVAHAGFLYLKRDPVSILKALKTLKKKYPLVCKKIEFHHIGGIDLDYDLIDYCKVKRIQDNIVLPGVMEHNDCLGYLSGADMLLIIQPGTKTQIPSKLYEYIYFDKPILAVTEKDSALGELLLNYGFGYVFEPGEHEKIAEFLYQMSRSKLESKNQTEFTPYENKAKFDVKQITLKFQNSIKSL